MEGYKEKHKGKAGEAGWLYRKESEPYLYD